MNPTPMRPKYKIEDVKLVKLIEKIFITVDQSWTDTQAHDVALLINDFIKEKDEA